MRRAIFDKDVLRYGDFGGIGTFFCSQVVGMAVLDKDSLKDPMISVGLGASPQCFVEGFFFSATPLCR